MGYAKDSDGRWHWIIDQTKGSSCGPACVRMVVKMVTGKDLGEGYARQLIERTEGGAISTLTSEAGGMGQAGDHNWGAHGARGSGGGGTGTWNVDTALQGLGVPDAHFSPDYPRNAFKNTSVKNPAIAAVGWNGGWNGKNAQGLHWIVVAGALGNGNYLILDPAYGLGEVSTSSAILEYLPIGGTKSTFVNDRTCLTAK